jgi:hypothetical protein
MAHLAGEAGAAIELLEEALASDSAAGSNSWVTRSELALAKALGSDPANANRAQSLASQAEERASLLRMSLLVSDARRLT